MPGRLGRFALLPHTKAPDSVTGAPPKQAIAPSGPWIPASVIPPPPLAGAVTVAGSASSTATRVDAASTCPPSLLNEACLLSRAYRSYGRRSISPRRMQGRPRAPPPQGRAALPPRAGQTQHASCPGTATMPALTSRTHARGSGGSCRLQDGATAGAASAVLMDAAARTEVTS